MPHSDLATGDYGAPRPHTLSLGTRVAAVPSGLHWKLRARELGVGARSSSFFASLWKLLSAPPTPTPQAGVGVQAQGSLCLGRGQKPGPGNIPPQSLLGNLLHQVQRPGKAPFGVPTS